MIQLSPTPDLARSTSFADEQISLAMYTVNCSFVVICDFCSLLIDIPCFCSLFEFPVGFFHLLERYNTYI